MQLTGCMKVTHSAPHCGFGALDNTGMVAIINVLGGGECMYGS
jgi:hypothetical protein